MSVINNYHNILSMYVDYLSRPTYHASNPTVTVKITFQISITVRSMLFLDSSLFSHINYLMFALQELKLIFHSFIR